MEELEKKPLFQDLKLDSDEPEVTEIESLCVNCEKNGITKLLLTKIPYFKDVVIMSFECDQCGYKNNELQSTGQIDETGIRITINVGSVKDLNRQVVKSDFTGIKVPHLQFEIPPQSQKGDVTTIESIITRAIAGLEQDQPLRSIQHPKDAEKVDSFIRLLEELKQVETPFTMIMEDITGNCFVENPYAPESDKDVKIEKFKRSKEQDHLLGFYSADEIYDNDHSGLLPEMGKETVTLEDLTGEVLTFHTNCPSCSTPCSTNMKLTKIPHFKEVVIMATVCDVCGHKTNEVKSSGGIEPKGLKIEVKIRGTDDFSRDVLKSETCELSVPEIELDAGCRTLAGKFTTVEGLIKDLKEGLEKGGATFGIFGDSRQNDDRISNCIQGLEEVLDGKKEVTLILDDPAGNSYVQSLSDSGLDEGIKIVHYERSFDQNEELGLNDMKTEGYEDQK